MITAENAAEYALRAQAARKRNKAAAAESARAEAAAAVAAASAPETARKKLIETEIDKLLFDLSKASADEKPALISALDKLWNLVFPKAGVNRPSRTGKRTQVSDVQPVAPVMPATEHN